MQKQKAMTEFVITCIIAFIILSGAVFQGWKKMKSEQEAQLNDSLRKIAEKELKDLQKLQLEKQFDILSKADSIMLDNQRVINQQSETLKHVLGFGFPRITVGYNNDRDFTFQISASEGYPIRNLNISSVDWSYGLKSKMNNGEIRHSDLMIYREMIPDRPLLSIGNELMLPVKFPSTELKAIEFRIIAEHAAFAIYIICIYDKEIDKVRYWYKSYEVDRKTKKFKLIDTNAKADADKVMLNYFSLKPYNVLMDSF